MAGKRLNVPKDITFSDAIAYVEKYRNGNAIPAAFAGSILIALSKNYIHKDVVEETEEVDNVTVGDVIEKESEETKA